MYIRREQVGDTRGDATAKYSVTLGKDATVKQFIHEVLHGTYSDEWGKIYIVDDLDQITFSSRRTSPQFEYRYGRIVAVTKSSYNKLMRLYGKKVIKRVSGDGGWSNMDYYIEVE